MSGPMFKGSITALITPFANGTVDEKRFQDFVDRDLLPHHPGSDLWFINQQP